MAKHLLRRMTQRLNETWLNINSGPNGRLMSSDTDMRARINDATKAAMKDKNMVRVSTLRLITAAIKDRDIAARAEDRCEGIDSSEILLSLIHI